MLTPGFNHRGRYTAELMLGFPKYVKAVRVPLRPQKIFTISKVKTVHARVFLHLFENIFSGHVLFLWKQTSIVPSAD